MSELSADELAIVAREVTGKPHYKHRWWGQYVITDNEYLCVENVYIVNFWNPQFTHDDPRRPDWQRSQALACVEHLIDAIWKRYAAVDSLGKDWLLEQLANVAHAIRDKDTEALMTMVLELRNPK